MQETKKNILIGNWKMNGSPALLDTIYRTITKSFSHLPTDVVICPPFPLLTQAIEYKKDILEVGAQDCHFESKGAYTGDVSPELLATLGVKFVIVGHSERRQYHKESNKLVCNKARMAIESGLIPIICIGESLDIYEQGKTLEFIHTQLQQSLPQGLTEDNAIIAYEPIWAIGTGKTATPADILPVHETIYQFCANQFANIPRIVYGGSANAANVKILLEIAKVDGLLVGGASLNAEAFTSMIHAAVALKS